MRLLKNSTPPPRRRLHAPREPPSLLPSHRPRLLHRLLPHRRQRATVASANSAARRLPLATALAPALATPFATTNAASPPPRRHRRRHHPRPRPRPPPSPPPPSPPPAPPAVVFEAFALECGAEVLKVVMPGGDKHFVYAHENDQTGTPLYESEAYPALGISAATGVAPVDAALLGVLDNHATYNGKFLYTFYSDFDPDKPDGNMGCVARDDRGTTRFQSM